MVYRVKWTKSIDALIAMNYSYCIRILFRNLKILIELLQALRSSKL